MTRHFARILPIIAFASTLVSAAAVAETRMALVIGNSSYRTVTTLRNPTNDAAAIAAVLANAGFEVMTVTDQTQSDMRRAIRDFSTKLAEKGPQTVALVFYAGHGLQVDGENFLVPIDARVERESDVAIETMRLADVMNALAAVPSRIRIVMLDACRNNPFETLSKGGGQGLAIVDAPSGSIVAYATAPGAEAADGAGRNSPYTAAFLKVVKQPELEIEQLFKRIRLLVNDATDGKQVPWESSSLTNDFTFFPVTAALPKKIDPLPAAATPPSPAPVSPPSPAVGNPPSPAADNPPAPAPIVQPGAAGPPAAERGPTPEELAKVKELRLQARRSEIRAHPAGVAYKIAIEEDNPLLYEEFIAAYPDDPLAERIRALLFHRQDAVAWRTATVVNTPEAYGAYVAAYSGGAYAIAAGRLREKPRLRPVDPIFAPRLPSRVVIRPPTVRPPPVAAVPPRFTPQLPKGTSQPKELPKATSLPKELPKATSLPKGLPKATSLPKELPKATSLPKELPKATTLPQQLPKATILPQQLPKATILPQQLPKATTLPQQLPKATSVPQQLPKATSLPRPPASTAVTRPPATTAVTRPPPPRVRPPPSAPRAAGGGGGGARPAGGGGGRRR